MSPSIILLIRQSCHRILIPHLLAALDMSNKNKKNLERDKEVTSLDRSARKKQEWLLRKKVSSIAAICGSLKKHKVRKRLPDENKKKPMRRAGPKEPKVSKEETCCHQPGHSKTMCPKCEIVTCRKCDTLHANSLFVAHSLLDHYDY
ncbi:uncharacterized protein C17orf50 homolog [Hyla sarda]|uniref:uncharacterized protein C17orf50 homolog n=1 Tax=Hyla sarda TaxID=327740 RepID=UPI0024C27D6B|nr:uncharacterized protein C17orf50 homolog [Hyla sarda]